MPDYPYIPETITVHLGTPDDRSAPNVTVPFLEYIQNVASSEIYPTWPESAIRANVYAQITYALNRIYTEYYRSRGYDFDIRIPPPTINPLYTDAICLKTPTGLSAKSSISISPDRVKFSRCLPPTVTDSACSAKGCPNGVR